MNMGSFAGRVKSRVEEKLGDGCRADVRKVNKNNGIFYTGMQVSEGGINISPIIYIDSQYREYEKGGTTIDSVADYVVDAYRKRRVDTVVDMRKFLSYNSVRKNVVYKLVNTAKNKELLEDIPHMEFLDLSIVFQCIVSQEELGMASILIHNVHMKLWDVTTKDLYAAARENTGRLLPYEIKSMAEVMHEIMESENLGQADYDECEAESADCFPMYVLSNKNRVEGAACLLYPDLIRDFADGIGSSLYIIPSSVHEVLLLPTGDDMEAAEIRNMIREVNDTQVSDEEILSYSLYYYDREEGEITIC